jgi:hypothetical protein
MSSRGILDVPRKTVPAVTELIPYEYFLFSSKDHYQGGK